MIYSEALLTEWRPVVVTCPCGHPGEHVARVSGRGSQTGDDGVRVDLLFVRFTAKPAGCGAGGGWVAVSDVREHDAPAAPLLTVADVDPDGSEPCGCKRCNAGLPRRELYPTAGSGFRCRDCLEPGSGFYDVTSYNAWADEAEAAFERAENREP